MIPNLPKEISIKLHEIDYNYLKNNYIQHNEWKEKQNKSRKIPYEILPPEEEIKNYIERIVSIDLHFTRNPPKSIFHFLGKTKWLILGILIIASIFFITPLLIYFAIPIVSEFIVKPFAIPLFVTFAFISSILAFIKWNADEGHRYNKWTPQGISAVSLLQLHASIIFGAFIFLNVIPDFKITDINVKMWLVGITTSIVIQFSVAALFVSLFGHLSRKKNVMNIRGDIYDPTPDATKIGLIFTFTGFLTLIAAMVLLGFSIGDITISTSSESNATELFEKILKVIEINSK